MGVPQQGNMAFVPYARGYGYPYAGYNYGAYGAGYPYGYGPYGPSLEEGKKVQEAEDRAKELMEAEKKQYEEFCEAQKKAVDDAVAKEKEFYEKERELAIKLGTAPFAYGYPGYGYGGYGHAGYGHRAGYGYPYGGHGYGRFY